MYHLGYDATLHLFSQPSLFWRNKLQTALLATPCCSAKRYIKPATVGSYQPGTSHTLLSDDFLGFHKLARVLEPEFDLSRLIMKVPSTWEGLQACSRLSVDGIKTLATTLFTMEQVVLAGEAGCISISPFAHELRAHLDTSCVGSPGSKVPR